MRRVAFRGRDTRPQVRSLGSAAMVGGVWHGPMGSVCAAASDGSLSVLTQWAPGGGRTLQHLYLLPSA